MQIPDSHSVPPSLTEDEFLGGRLRILQPEKGFRAGVDSVLLAAAIPCEPGDSVFEAGIGPGVAALCLLFRNPEVQVTGIEVAARYVMICEENARRNGMQNRLRVIHADVRDALRRDHISMPAPGGFAHAMLNPPFFDEAKSTSSPNLLKSQAHAFGPEDLDLWVKLVYAMLSPRGSITLVHRPDSLGQILAALENRFGDIHIAPLFPRPGLPASRILVQGIKGSKAPLQILPGLVLHGDGSEFTREANAMLRSGAPFILR
ncbi:MAG: methyltransferase [Aestuariivirga sp.]|uniref:tRNA1(Val) (adenine(37)-N6)-methyltransferase n=1 Tax=Aestuariivirga sp. TaxID=2650926 RepID=UPI0025C4E5CC|nr:methyltransferase [Aestuariivirga sp.]MCA3559418.1 methyltransferase [Aestuariivirga sp.]